MQVQALDSLAKALHVEVLELRRERARALSSRGIWGHLKNLLGYLLSAYCLIKYMPHLINAMASLLRLAQIKIANEKCCRATCSVLIASSSTA